MTCWLLGPPPLASGGPLHFPEHDPGVGGYRGTRRESRLASTRRIKMGSWNLETLICKFYELVNVLKKKRVDIACFQETNARGRAPEKKPVQVMKRRASGTLYHADHRDHIGAEANGYSKVHEDFGTTTFRLTTYWCTKETLGYVKITRKGVASFRTKVTEGVTTEVEGTSRTHISHKESWWLSDEVIYKIEAKQTRFRELMSMQGEDQANIIAAKERIERKRRKIDLGSVRSIRDEDGRNIVNEDTIGRRLEEYSAIFNGQRCERTEEVERSVWMHPSMNGEYWKSFDHSMNGVYHLSSSGGDGLAMSTVFHQGQEETVAGIFVTDAGSIKVCVISTALLLHMLISVIFCSEDGLRDNENQEFLHSRSDAA
ncbi:hypothetical protein Tco_0526951 [Tanacetum coccineum]